MRNNLIAIGYNGISDTDNILSPNAEAYDYKIQLVVVSNKANSKEKGEIIMSKNNKILRIYDRIIALMVLFAAFSLVTATTGKILDTLGSLILLLMSSVGIYAFVEDRKRWRRGSEKRT